MKKVFLSLFMILFVCVPCFGDELTEISPVFERNSVLYIWLNNLRVRESPDLSSKITDTLQFAEEVEYLNEINDIKSRATLRGKTYNAPWVKIKSKSGKTGWVYSVGLMADFIKIYTESGYPEDQISFAHFYKNLSPFVPNEEGKKLVATEPLNDPNTITKAFYSSYYPDKVADIKYVGNKPSTGNEFFSFERGEGPLYEVLGNQVVEGKGFVVDDLFFEDRNIVSLTSAWRDFPEDSTQYKELKSRVETLRKWEIDNMWIKYTDDNSNLLAVVLHKVYKGHVLLSVIFATSEEVVFHDHIAEYNEGDDLFRVDDMGEFDSYSISIDYLLKSKNGYELVYHWDGAEGRNIYVVRQYKDRFFLGRRIYQPVSY